MHRVRNRRVSAIVLALVISGCAGNKQPETAVAHYGNTVLETATALQKGITAATDAKTLPVDIAQKLTSYSEQIYQKSGPLGDALRAYHTATTLDLRKLKAAEVQALINDVNSPLSKILQEAIPQPALQQITTLVANVMASVAAVQAEVAKAMGGQS